MKRSRCRTASARRSRCRAAHHIGRIEPAAEAGFEQHGIGCGAGKGQKGGSSRDLEKRNRFAAIGALALLEHVEKRVFLYQFTRDPNALVKPHQVRC